jgi:ABC-type xylose transport system permease subunit
MATKAKNGFVKTLIERSKADTPPFFKKLRMAGLILTAVGGALVAAPIALPAAIVTAAGYLVVAGSVVTAVSQVAVPEAKQKGRSGE